MRHIRKLAICALMLAARHAEAAPGVVNVTVLTTSTQVVPAASTTARTQATIYNNSTSLGTIWCRDDGQPAVIGAGIAIYPPGAGPMSYTWAAPNVTANPINCVSNSTSTPVSGSFYQ